MGMTITKLEPSQHVKERWLVWLDSGELLRVSENEVVAFGLYAGMELPRETLEQLSDSAARSAVRAKALDYIAARPLSRKELVDKLAARPRNKDKQPMATPEQAAQVADWLEELGYLNDAEYAKTIARHYSAKGYGQAMVRDELFRRGVPRECWADALEESQPPEEGIDAFLRKRFKGGVPDQKELKRASDALARRGYRWNEIREGLNRYGANIDEE